MKVGAQHGEISGLCSAIISYTADFLIYLPTPKHDKAIFLYAKCECDDIQGQCAVHTSRARGAMDLRV